MALIWCSHPPSHISISCGAVDFWVLAAPAWCMDITDNLLFWNSAMEFFPGFPLQAVRCFFLQVLVLDTFAVGPIYILLWMGNIYFRPFWPVFHSVFFYGYSSWAQFWLFHCPGINILPLASTMDRSLNGFSLSSSGTFWLGHIKAITLS